MYLLTDVQLAGEPLGVAVAFANAILFALYIVLAHRVARHEALSGIDGLAASMLIAALVVTPMAGWAVIPAALDPVALVAGIGVGLCSSVIPYVTDQLAMAKLARATYALMVSILPATATVIGILVLAQVPTPAEIAGVALVMAGRRACTARHRRRRDPAAVGAVCGLAGCPAVAGSRVVLKELLQVVDLLIDGVAVDRVDAAAAVGRRERQDHRGDRHQHGEAGEDRAEPARPLGLALRLGVGLAGPRCPPRLRRDRAPIACAAPGRGGHVAEGAGGVRVDRGQAAGLVGHLAAEPGVHRLRHLERSSV